ncbi:protein FAM72A-like [Biomphalaria glabrata]|uniref:Protein FAM72A-like n=1 Tax=Biomphalaria glabrata TaxID=6526 RepID=A0A9W3A981_BIOGL|nr:protein FAM72A-like [Biomphalaria glabrata]XP_055883717.1 protein FAM72A-like [Biomphalaria glabrata]XP_055883718.1 protein FAM72A-like [Biomphalaria glabrata]KAI8730935.1 protein FAM72A-like [Biomphalaria glabrata]KAI8782155.1 protein FAM72A [Biomphalaria glabrata]
MVLTNLNQNFGRKVVYVLDCKVCGETLSRRGMLAVLVADGKTELFSTDKFDRNAVGLVPEVYTANSCKCKVQSIACLCCGQVVGYDVLLPCMKCLSSVNNGHHSMFHSSLVSYCYRLDEEANNYLLWKDLKSPKEDGQMLIECLR